MKTSKFFFILAGLAAIASSCAKETAIEDNPKSGDVLVINATLVTKTAFSGTDASDNHIVSWNEGDVITVFDTEGNAYVSEGCAGGESVTFTVNGFPDGKTPAYAVYSGASPSDSWSSGKINTVAKSVQTVTSADNFADGAALCVGEITSDGGVYGLVMHHAAGFLKLKVDMDNISEITLSGNGTNDALAGQVAITPGTAPAVAVTSAVKAITLKCDVEGVSTFTKGKDYYICAVPGTISKPVITVRNTYGNTVKLVRSTSVEVRRGEIGNLGTLSGLSWDLSAPGTANCYVVNCAGNYKFTPTQGCSDEPVGEIASVELLWETAANNADTGINVHDVIKTVGFNEDYITFSTADKYQSGNALIAAKDATGTILWSWHIWLVESKVTDIAWANGMMLMDRSLGEVKATGTPRSSMLYQWGRKDPFPGGRGDSKFIGVAGTATSYAKAQGDVSKSIKNPTVVYGVISTSSAGAQPCGLNCGDDDMWGEDGNKTIYDPCPFGYKVPVAGTETDGNLAGSRFAELSNAPAWYSSTSGDHLQNTFEIILDSGVMTRFGRSASIKLNTKTAEYSKCKYELQLDGTAFYMWTANSLGKRRGVCIRCASSSSGVNPSLQATTSDTNATYNSKNNGYSVRCERIAVSTKSSEPLSRDVMTW